MVHLTPTSTCWLYNVHGNTPQLLKVSHRTFFKFDRSFQVGIRPGESFFSWPPDGIGKMCSIQGDGWLRGLAPTNLFCFLFFMMSHFTCQVLSSGAWSHLFCAVHLLALLCLCCMYLYIYNIHLLYSLVADDVPRHLGFLMFVADDLPRYPLQRLGCLYSSGVVPAQDLTCVARSAGT